MSTRDLVESLYEALADGDRPALTALLHPDFVGVTAAGMPLGLGGTYESPESMQQDFWWPLGRAFDARAVAAEIDVLDAGRVVVHGSYRGRGRASGLPLDAAFVHVIRVLDGRVAGLEQLTDTAAWHVALGEIPLETLALSVEDGLAMLRLRRPAHRNAIDLQMAQELLSAARTVQSDASVRALLICGDGADLSVGGDIAYFTRAAGDDLGALFRRMTTPFHEAFSILHDLDVPIVTAGQGAVAGGGLGFVYAADIAILADDARLVTAFGALGVSGDGGGSWHLPRRIGPARAARIMLENRPVTAREALDWGLVAEVVPAETLHDHARAVARALAAGPTRAFAGMRRLLRETWDHDLPTQLRLETELLVGTGRTHDAGEAVRAFVEKRRPTFEGR